MTEAVWLRGRGRDVRILTSLGAVKDLGGYTSTVTSDYEPAVNGTSTRDALLAAGSDLFRQFGFSASLEVICAAAQVTTGAFYGHFSTKMKFFEEIFAIYESSAGAALDDAKSLSDAVTSYVQVGREHAGAIRASSELLLRDEAHAGVRRSFRLRSANALMWQLRGDISQVSGRVGTRLIVDILDQCLISEIENWRPPRPAPTIAAGIDAMVKKGVFL